jgi:high-affinity Fe2+/Pb2+ permease
MYRANGLNLANLKLALPAPWLGYAAGKVDKALGEAHSDSVWATAFLKRGERHGNLGRENAGRL